MTDIRQWLDEALHEFIFALAQRSELRNVGFWMQPAKQYTLREPRTLCRFGTGSYHPGSVCCREQARFDGDGDLYFRMSYGSNPVQALDELRLP